IGLVPALLLLLGVSMAGAWLLKREGMATWRRLQETIQRGGVPAKEVTDGALILLGGALLLTPGFITDVVGLLLVFPLTRALVKSTFRRFVGSLATKRIGAVGYAGRTGKRIYDARVVRTRPGTTPDVAGLPPEIPPTPAEPSEGPN
ncbi:MAG: protein FxsA, partial [Actinomycetota bacterium]|nr:protein FxsA [Actinomycetota bacterium]